MHPVAAFDLVTFLASAVTLIILLAGWKRALQPKAKHIFVGLLVFTMCYGLCLFVEWSLGTKVMDRAEDVIGALVPMWWAFVFYAFFAGIVEEELRAREAGFEELFDNAPIGYHELDTEGHITRVNRTELEMYGYSQDQMLGKSVWEFYVDKKKSRQAVAAKLTGKIPPGQAFERKIQRTDGTVIPVLIEDRLLYDKEGRIRGIRSTIQNITKRKQAEESLAKESNLLRTLINNMPDNIFVKDTKSRFVIANISVAHLMGTTPEDLLGKTDFDFYPRQLAEKYYANSQKVIRTGRPMVGQEELAIDPAGKSKWFSTTKVPLRDSRGRIIGIVGMSRDITVRKFIEKDRVRLMQKLALKNEELESILYVTSHDLRSPLVNIQGFSNELARSCDLISSALKKHLAAADVSEEMRNALDKDIPQALNFIVTSANKMDTLLNGLLRLSRLGQAALKIEPLDMNAMLANVTKNIEYQTKKAGAKINIEKLPPCCGDASQINQVFSNILDNALKYLDESRPGVINISAETDNGRCIYRVEDNGVGIAPEKQNKIFEIFHRLEPDKTKGEGLGLTIVRRILDRHNGKVWVESELGKGSKFFISLPSE